MSENRDAESEGLEVIDPIGEKTLRTISSADNFNQWMYQSIKPFCKGRVLEIGSGIGNISGMLIADKHEIFLSDFNKNYCQQLEMRFGKFPNFLGTAKIDLCDPQFEQEHANHLGQYDTVFALNVVEHIEDHNLAIKNCYSLLKPGGHIIILVPAYMALYNRFDKELGHFRRYTKSSLTQLISANQFEIIHARYFNAAGIAGWFTSGRILNKASIPAHQMNLFNKLVPVFKLVDKVSFHTVGLSTIVVGKK